MDVRQHACVQPRREKAKERTEKWKWQFDQIKAGEVDDESV